MGPGSLPSWAAGLGCLLFLVFSAWIGMSRLIPPAIAPTDTPVTEFASGRAMHHLHVIAHTPHPIGSPVHTAVRQYILQELMHLGLRPAVQTTTAVNHRRTPVNAGTVHNIVARLQGTGYSKAILLVAHYDSVPTGPGASDDGAAVAAMLETARALTASAPLSNDVIFLFTDGEESGLLVAHFIISGSPGNQNHIEYPPSLGIPNWTN